MICHGELVKLKPANNQLTLFYLMLALGGFVGSALVAFIATEIFTQYVEYPLALIAILLVFAFSNHFSVRQKRLTGVSLSAGMLLLAMFLYLNQQFVKSNIMSARNFYGIISVIDVEFGNKKERRLIDGTTSHGTQSLLSDQQNTPLSYYRKDTGVAIALELLAKKQLTAGHTEGLNVGVVGLGAGTLAAYGKAGDNFTFYELNPGVIQAAKQYFSYLQASEANIAIIEGDGRVSLEQQAKQGIKKPFDLLVIDAFSGDSIPQHLLTQEAISLYLSLLADTGIVAIHISNSHLDLTPLMLGHAEIQNLQWQYFIRKATSAQQHDAHWFWLTKNQTLANDAQVKAFNNNHLLKNKKTVLWRDDYSNLLSVLK